MLAAGLTIFLVAITAIGANTYRGMAGWSAVRYEPAALSAKLAPGYRVVRPRGAGPFPTVILFSGCDGPKDNLSHFANLLGREGWAVVIVDSHGPRNYDRLETWRLVCSGQLLVGAERAADVAVALDDVRDMPFVDASNIALMGASHGGWAVLDFLALQGSGRVSPILTRWPDSVVRDGIAGIRSVVALYPYCGALSVVGDEGWPEQVPALFLLVASDRIADDQACRRVAARQDRRGGSVDVVTFSGVTHGFDQREKEPLSALRFDARARDAAGLLVRDFLADHARR